MGQWPLYVLRGLSMIGAFLVLGSLWGCSEKGDNTESLGGTRLQIEFVPRTPAPAEVERLELRVMNPEGGDVLDMTPIDRDRLEVTVQVPIGDPTVFPVTFQVDAFMGENRIPTFRGRTAVETIPPEGLNVTVRARQIRLEAIDITPSNPTLTVGQSQQFTATGRLSDGSSMDLTTDVNWRTSDPEVLEITASGLATVVGVGTVTILTTSTEPNVNAQLGGLMPTIVTRCYRASRCRLGPF